MWTAKKKTEFNKVLNEGTVLKGKFYIVGFFKNSLDYSRFGIIVSKRVSGNSVQRNYQKRILREFFRSIRSQLLFHVDIVVIVKKNSIKFESLNSEFLFLINKYNEDNK